MPGTNDREIMDDIRKDLKSRNRSVRALACKSLARFGNNAAAFLLVGMLSDRDPDVRFHASESLFALGECAVANLVAALGHDEWIVRRQASEVLRRMSRAIPAVSAALRGALNSEDQNVRFWAVKTLCEMGSPEVAPLVKKIFRSGRADDKVAIASAVAGEGMPAEIRKAVLGGLSDPVWRVRKACADALSKSGPAVVEELIEKLSAPGIDSYYWATRVLGALRDDRAVDPLIAALGGADEERAEFAVAALGEIGNSRAARSLIGLLGSDSWTIRKTAAEALTGMGDLVMRDVAEKYSAADSSDDARYWCVRIAGGFASDEAGGLILKALSDPKWFVRSCACHSLTRQCEPGEKHIIRLFELLGDRNSEVARSAERALDTVDREKIVAAARSILESCDCPTALETQVRAFLEARGEKLSAREPARRRQSEAKQPRKVSVKKNDQQALD